MRKISFLSIFIISSLCLTSCLDIFENFKINKDGSGEYQIVMTIGEQFRQQIATAIEEQEAQSTLAKANSSEENEDAQDQSYKESLEQITKKLKSVDGISNVEMIYNQTEFKFGYTFQFKNIEALDKALEVSAGEFQPKLPAQIQLSKKKVIQPSSNYVELSKGTFVRHQSAELSKILNMKKTDGNNAGMMGGLDVTYLLQDMNYKTVFQFAQPIKTAHNEAAVIDDKNHTVTLHCKPFAYRSADLNEQKLQDLACSQSVVIEIK